jgi:cell division protein FtsA
MHSVPKEIIAAIDVGTTKICVLVGAVTHDSLGKLTLRMLGSGVTKSRGIRRGVVMDVPEVTGAIGEVIEIAEREAGLRITSAYVGIAGSHIATTNSKGISPIDSYHGVTGADMHRALEGAQAVSLPESREVIHVIARSWQVDEQDGIQQPLGMSGHRLEVDAHIVTGTTMAINNLAQCVLAHGIDIDELVLEPLASGEAVLTPEERQMGVIMADIGGGTTDLALFRGNGLWHTEVLDMGGNHLTNDVAMGLRAPFEVAEELKLRYGHLQPQKIAEDEQVWATVFGDRAERTFSRRFISQILEARAEEVCEIIQKRTQESGYGHLVPAGMVLTGGSSQLTGVVELSRRIFGMPVRIGYPGENVPIQGLSRDLQSPAYATSVGLLLWGLHEDARAIHRPVSSLRDDNAWVDRLRGWLRNLLPG